MNAGEAYFDHYERFMRAPIGARKFAGDDGRQVQILAYDGVFPQAMVFASLGVSQWTDCIGHVTEVVCVVDDALETAPALLANCLFYFAQRHSAMRRGTLVDSLGNLSPKFALRFGKSALYLTSCQGFPSDFSKVKLGGDNDGSLVQAVFLSKPEAQFLRENGVEAFETSLQGARVDPIALSRPSLF